MKLVDDLVIIPGACGSLITGLVYGFFTSWGFFRHRWVTIKWIVTAGGILAGTFFLGPWLNALPPCSAVLGAGALVDAGYAHHKSMAIAGGAIQTASLIVALIVSVLRPWRKRPVRDGPA